MKTTTKRRFDRAVSAGIERLEGRRLLAITFDDSTGVLNVSVDAGNDIVQFETRGTEADGVTGFRVYESNGDGAPAGTTEADYINYINDSTTPVISEFFDVAGVGEIPEGTDVRRVVVTTFGGNDLVIAGQTLSVPINVVAGGGDDTISGGPRADTVLAEGGNDYIFGGRGNDLMAGGAGDDNFIGGAGNDTVDYRNRTDQVSVTIDGLANDGQLNEGERDNVQEDIETLVGGSGNDFLSAPAVTYSVRLVGGAGNDTLRGSQADDTLIGGVGQDSLVGLLGRDFIFAADGEADIIDANENEAPGTGNAGGPGQDLVYGDLDPAGSVSDTFNGTADESAFEGSITGDSGSTTDSVTGNATFEDGVLSFTGSESADRITVVSYAGDSRVTFFAGSRDGSRVEASGNLLASDIREIFIRGLGGNDSIIVSGVTASSRLDGGAGDDTIIGSNGGDNIFGGQSSGGATPDTGGDDFIFGSGGNDIIEPGYGGDYIAGGSGTDRLSYADRVENLVVGLGVLADDGESGESDDVKDDIEILLGGSGDDDFSTTSDNDVRLFGNAGNDTLEGGIGNDIFDGGPGRDIMRGLEGDDTFFAEDNEIDTLFGGSGNDTASTDSNDERNDIP